MAEQYPQGQMPTGAAPAGMMPEVTPQITPQTPPKQKKKFNVFSLIIVLVALAAGAYLGYQYILAPKPEFEVDGKKFTMKSTPKDIMDAGLVICDKNGKIVDFTGNSVLPKTVPSTEYQVGIPLTDNYATETGIYFKVMNTATNAKGAKDCMVYSVSYRPSQDKTGGKVLINGQDLTNLDAEKWVEAFKAAKYPFSNSDLDRFKNGSTTIILGERGQYKYEAHTETSSKVPSYVIFTNAIKTESAK